MATFYYDKGMVRSAINIVKALPNFDKWRSKYANEIWLSEKKGGAGTRLILQAEDERDGSYWVGATISTYLDKDGNPSFKSQPDTYVVREQATRQKNVADATKWFKDQVVNYLQRL